MTSRPIDELKRAGEAEKTSSWDGGKPEPSSPRDLIKNDARTKAKKWLDAASAVGVLYKFRDPPKVGPAPVPEPLWPIAGIGCRMGRVDETSRDEPAIVVYTLKEFPMPPFLQIADWDGYPILYVEMGGR